SPASSSGRSRPRRCASCGTPAAPSSSRASSRAEMGARWVVLGAVLVLAGCGRTVTEEDCTHIKENMRAAWAAESKKAAPSDAAGAEKAQAVIKAEGDKLS